MKLQDLSATTDTPVPSIKYYLRIGLLPPGWKKNLTTAVYDDSHVARLELIAALRQIVGAPIDMIRSLTPLIDDPASTTIAVLQTAQQIGAGFHPSATPAEVGDDVRARVTGLIAERSWPDVDSSARREVEQVLGEMAAYGYTPGDAHFQAVSAALDDISGLDIDWTIADTGGDRNRLAMRVAVGTHQHARLVLALLRLGHASHSIRRYEQGA